MIKLTDNKISDIEIVEYIKQIILLYFNEDQNCFKSKSRKHSILKIKQYACFLSKRHTTLSNQQIADFFMYKNHSSIISLTKKLQGYSLYDKNCKRELEEIETIIKLKGLSKDDRINFDKYYYINLNDCKSTRETPERAIVFIGYTDEEIINLLNKEIEIKEHKNTCKFILEKTEL